MGQGAHTGLATIVAEELDADFASVRVVNAANGAKPGGDVYGTPAGGGLIQLTGASTSTVGFLGPLPAGPRPPPGPGGGRRRGGGGGGPRGGARDVPRAGSTERGEAGGRAWAA